MEDQVEKLFQSLGAPNSDARFTNEILNEIHAAILNPIFFDESGPGVMLRHDVDDDLDRSLRLAEIQSIKGIKATYFLLNTAPYWKGDPCLWPKARAIQAMGHRVEWHNDCITDAAFSLRRKSPFECAQEVLSQFRDNGIPVTGSASHGNGLCHKLKYINYQAFSECQEQSGTLSDTVRMALPPDFQPFPMAELGLNWEAYHVPHDLYFSEPGGKWKAFPSQEVLSRTDLRIQVLIHPQHWKGI